MSLTRRRALVLAAAFAATSPRPAGAQQNWPQRPLRILVGTSPGGSPDIIGRLLADKMADRLGQTITVENNTGGGGGIAASMVTHAPPDGYNMTLLTAGWASGAAIGKFAFDGDNTFGFLTMVCAYPFVYSVPADSPIKSFADMLARAKANPGKVSYSITSLGSVYHLIGSWVGSKAGIDMVPMTSPGRYPLLPEAPTVAETLPGIHYMSWLGMAAAPHTPRPIVDRLNAELRRPLELPDVIARLKEGGNVATPTTPEEMHKQVADEIANWKQVIASNHIKLN
jgi:tripartite-type tricarboxylate transporter receptor subunit TctC